MIYVHTKTSQGGHGNEENGKIRTDAEGSKGRRPRGNDLVQEGNRASADPQGCHEERLHQDLLPAGNRPAESGKGRNLLVQPAVYNRRFLQFEDTGAQIRDAFAETLANTLTSSRSIKMVEEETVYNMMVRFSHFIDDAELRYTTAEELLNALPSLQKDLRQIIQRLLS